MAGKKIDPKERKEGKVVILTTKKQELAFREKCERMGVPASQIGRDLFDEFLTRR